MAGAPVVLRHLVLRMTASLDGPPARLWRFACGRNRRRPPSESRERRRG